MLSPRSQTLRRLGFATPERCETPSRNCCTWLPNAFDNFSDRHGDTPTAWAPSAVDSSSESLTLGYATPAQATGVVVRETNGNGFVSMIELEDTTNTWHTIWSGTDPATQGAASDLIVSFAQTAYDVEAVRITVNPTLDPNDFAEIDAVRLVTGGSPTTTTATVSAFDQPPISADAWASTDESTAAVIPVLANDSSPAGYALTVSAVGSASDGTVAISGSGQTVTYTPTTGYTGPDSFTYTISDGYGGSATSTVYVTVANGQWASTVLGFSSQADDATDTYGTSVLALGPPDTEVYGDTSNSWSPSTSSTATTETLTLGIASPAYANGVLVRESSGNGFVTQIELQDTSNAWHTVWTGTDATPAGNVQNFLASFTTTSYQAQAVRITVDPTTGDGNPVGIDAVEVLTSSAPPTLPAAPSAANDSATVDENMPVNINVLANDTNTADSQLYLRIVSAPANGTAVISLNGDPSDSSGDYINYTPNANFSGSDSFVYSITDAFGQTSSATVSITVSHVNQLPVAGSTSAITTAGTSKTLNLLTNASDPDTSDTLSVASFTQGQNGTVTVSGGVATYTPDTGFVGEDEFTYVISDGVGQTSTGTAQVTVYPAGQWASSVISYSSGSASTSSVLGAPDQTPWTPDGTTALDFITVGFTTPEYATGVIISETSGAAIAQVQLLDSTGTYHALWSGTDPTADGSPADFTLNFPATSYLVTGVQVFVSNANGDAGIDAVQLLTGGSATSVTLSANTFDSSGDYVETTYNSASQPILIYTYTGGVLTQTVANTYTSGYVSATITTNALGNETRDTFDANGNVLTAATGYGTSGVSTTTDTYNSDNEILSLTDPDGNETDWAYTTNETVMTDPLGNTDVKNYNNQNQLVSELNRNGELTTYEYETDGDLETETEYSGATDTSSVVDELEWTYTAAGQVATAGNDQGTYAFTYDDQNRVIQVEGPFGVILQFGYDQYGNRNLIKDNLGGEETSLYNASNQLLSRTLTQGGQTMRIDFAYNQLGQVVTETRYSDAAGTDLVAITAYTYDKFGNIASIENTSASSVVIDEFDSAYDSTGQELASETDYQPTLNSSPQTTDYSYDDQEQITAAGSNDYSYDDNGNRDMSGYTYNTTQTNEITSDGTWNYTTDNNGNITGKTSIATGAYWVYTYDNRNLMTSAKEYDSSSPLLSESDYKYDVYGNRIEQDVTVSGVTTVQRYALDGWNPAKSNPVGNEDFDVLADLNGSNDVTTEYLRGDNVDQLLGRVDVASGTGSTKWTLTDSQGSVREVIDNTGAVKDSIAYDAFGNITNESDASYRGRYAYTGRELDVETGLQYNRARYYDSTTGRWISQDPLGFNAGDSNLYRYVNDNPTNHTDPSGYITILVHGLNGKGEWYQDFTAGLTKYYTLNDKNPTTGSIPGVIGYYWNKDDGSKPSINDYTNDFTAFGKQQKLLYQEDRAANLSKFIFELRQTLNRTGHKDEPINIIAHSGGTMITLRALQIGSKSYKVQNVILMGSPFDYVNDKSNLIKSALIPVAGNLYNFYTKKDAIITLANGNENAGAWKGDLPKNVIQVDYTNKAAAHILFATEENAKVTFGSLTRSNALESIPDLNNGAFANSLKTLLGNFDKETSWFKEIVK